MLNRLFSNKFRPFYTNFRAIPSKTTFIIWMIKIITFIAKFCYICKNKKTMCKPFWNKKLFLVFFCKENSILESKVSHKSKHLKTSNPFAFAIFGVSMNSQFLSSSGIVQVIISSRLVVESFPT